MTTTEIRDRLTNVRRRQEELMEHPIDDNTDELLDQLTITECELEDALLDEGDAEFVDAFLDWIGENPVVVESTPYVEESSDG